MASLFNLLSRKASTQHQGRATSPGGTTIPAAVTQTQEEDLGPTMLEMLGNSTPGGVPPVSHLTYGAGHPTGPFGLSASDRGMFGGGYHLRGDVGAGMGGGELRWGGGGGGSGEAPIGGVGGRSSFETLGAQGFQRDLFGEPTNEQGLWGRMGGGGFGYGGLSPAGHAGIGQQQLFNDMHQGMPSEGGNSGGRPPQTPGQEGTTENNSARNTTPAPTATPAGNAGRTPPTAVPGDKPGALTAVQAHFGKYDSEETKADSAIQEETDKDVVRDQILQSNEPVFMMFLSGPSARVRILHSFALCPQARVPPHSDMGGKVIGFTIKTNTPMVLPTNTWWDSKQVTVPPGVEAVAARTGQQAPVWASISSGPVKNIKRTCIVPRSLVAEAYEWTTKGLDCLKCFEDLCDKFPEEDKFAKEKEWLLAASQGTPNAGSTLSVTISAADQEESQFEKWCQDTLTLKKVLPMAQAPAAQTATASTTPIAPPPPGVDPNTAWLINMQQTNQQAMLNFMQQQQQQNIRFQAATLQQMQQGGGGGVGGVLSSHATPGKGPIKSWDTYAAIMSLCNVTSMPDLPFWWREVRDARKEEIRDKWHDAQKWILEWALRHGLPIHQSFEPEDDVIWAFITGNFRGSSDHAKNATKQLSPYNGMPVSTDELERRQIKKDARDASARNRSYAEAVHIETEKGGLPSPPGDYDSVLKTIVAFTGIVALLFGESCDLYTKLMGLVTRLKGKEVEQNALRYLGVKSRQIFWLVLVDAKRYCNQAHTAREFKTGARFPESMLHHYYIAIENAAEIEVMGFPEKWKAAAPYFPPIQSPASTQVMHQSWWNVPPGPLGQVPPVYPPSLPSQPGGGIQQPEVVVSGRSRTNTANSPARVVQACERVNELFPKARFVHFVAAAGKKMTDLPKIRGKPTCYNYLLGQCKKPGCGFEHYEIGQLQASEYEEWIISHVGVTTYVFTQLT